MSNRPVIFSTHPLHPRPTAMLAGHCDLVIASAIDPITLADEARDADIVIVRANLPPVLFERAPKLRAAIRHGAGLDMIPVDAARALEQRIAGPSKLWVVPKARHNGAVATDPEGYRRRLLKFFRLHLAESDRKRRRAADSTTPIPTPS